MTDAFLPSPDDTSNPWIRLFRMVDAQDDSNVPFDGNVEYGMASAYTFVQALLAAGKNLTRQSMIAGIAGHGTSWQGPALVPFSYSSHDHSGLSGAQLGQIENGKLVLLGQPLTTTAGPEAAITPYPRPRPRRRPADSPRRLGPPGGRRPRERGRSRRRCLAVLDRRRTFAGTPAATEWAGMSAVTTELAPITHRSPIVTPPVMTTCAPHQTLSPIRVGPLVVNPCHGTGRSGSSKRWQRR